MPLRCLIVDDNPSFLAAARVTLEREGAIVVGVATTAADALRQGAELDPEVILVDITLGADSGLDLTRELARDARDGRPQIILVSAHPEDDFADLVAESPALGFIAKSELSAAAIAALVGTPDQRPSR